MNMSKSKLLSLMLVGSASMAMAACGKKDNKPTVSPKQFKQSLPKKAIKPGGILTYALENDSPFTGIFSMELADTSPDVEAM